VQLQQDVAARASPAILSLVAVQDVLCNVIIKCIVCALYRCPGNSIQMIQYSNGTLNKLTSNHNHKKICYFVTLGRDGRVVEMPTRCLGGFMFASRWGHHTGNCAKRGIPIVRRTYRRTYRL